MYKFLSGLLHKNKQFSFVSANALKAARAYIQRVRLSKHDERMCMSNNGELVSIIFI